MPEASFTQLEEARVLVQHGGKNRRGPEIFDGTVGESGAIALSVTSGALTVAGLTVFRLAEPRQKTVPRELYVVKGRPRHDLEFLPGG